MARSIEHVQIMDVKPLGTTPSGNLYYKLTVNSDHESVYFTARDGAINGVITNSEYQQPHMVTLILERQRVVNVLRED